MKIVYVLGMGRSGSTLLDIILGSHPELKSIGELIWLPQSLLQEKYCSCGEPINACPYWQKVIKAWESSIDNFNLEEYLSLQSHFHQKLAPKFKGWHRLIKEKNNNIPSKQFIRYSEYTTNLYNAINSVDNTEWIVESSKWPQRMVALSMIENIELKVVWLIRDPRGVAWSMKKSVTHGKKANIGIRKNFSPRPSWRTALAWLFINLQSQWALHYFDNIDVMLVRYEDVVQKFQETLDDLGNHVGIDTELINQLHLQQEGLSINSHMIAGNPVRMKTGGIRLSYDSAWKRNLSRWNKFVIQVLTGWLMKKYGFKNNE